MYSAIYGVLWITFSGLSRADMGFEGLLKTHLFSNYCKEVRPTAHYWETVNISFHFMLAKIERLDEKNQAMISYGWITQIWNDAHLKWRPEEFGWTPSLIVPASLVWRPEFITYSSMENFSDLAFSDHTRVHIWPNGDVKWVLGLRWVTYCAMDLRLFPFDTQTCDVTFLSWAHTEDLLNYTNLLGEMGLDGYQRSGAWILVSATTFRFTAMYESPEAGALSYPVIGFVLVLERIPTYYCYNIVIPIGILTFHSGLVFIIPSEAGEKVSLQVTILLAHSVMLLVISDVTPQHAPTTPILTEYTTLALTLTAVSLTTTALLLNVYYHSPDKPVPRWVKLFVLGAIAKCVCLNICCGTQAQYKVNKDLKRARRPLRGTVETNLMSVVSVETAHDSRHGTLLETVQRYLQQKIDSEQAQETQDANRSDWQKVSRVLDRLFLFGYLGTLVGITVATYLTLQGAGTPGV